MNNPIFNKEDFRLCDVPVPNGYPQSQTHSGVALYDGKYYLTTSPYPGKRYSHIVSRIRSVIKKLSGGLFCNPKAGEVYENPCIYIGVQENDEIPAKFKPLTARPLMNIPEAVYGRKSYNSDPDIFIENDLFYILNRTFYRTNQKNECVINIFFIKGTVNHDKFKLQSIEVVKEWKQNFVSPCLTKFRGKYIFTRLDTNSALDTTTFNGLFLQELDEINQLKSVEDYKKININSSDLLPWHMSLFCYNEILFTIIACVKKGDKTQKIWQMLGEFNDDLTELTIYPTPLTDYNSYRGAAIVTDDGTFVLYSTVLWEHIKGSNSIDGRDVIVANCKFEDLLCQIRKNNC